jgi:hypothetical protein
MDSLLNSTRPLRKELTPMPLKSFHKIEREGTLPNSVCKASITLISKHDKDTHKKKKKNIGQFP